MSPPPPPGPPPAPPPGPAPPPAPATPRKLGLPALVPYLRGHAPVLVTVAVLSLAAAGAALAQPLLIRTLINAIQDGDPVARLVIILIGLVGGAAALGGLRDYLLQRTAEGLVLTLRERLSAHLLRLPITEYDQRRTGDLLSRVGADTTLLRAVVTSGLFELVAGVLMVIGATVAMLVVDPLLFLVTLGGLAIGLTMAVVFARRVRPLSEQAQARLGEMTSAVERAISAARTIRAARAEQREAGAVADSARQTYLAGLRVARLRALIGPASSTAIQGAFLLVLGVGGARVAAGAITVGDLVAFVLFLFFLVMPLGQAINAYTQLQTGLGALTRIEEILDLPTEDALDHAATAPPPVVHLRDEAGAPAVRFDGVSFGYQDGGPVLREVSFTVPYGTRTALVGPSGAGKSTILALVERFYDTDAGSIQIGGTDIRRLSRDQLRAQLGYVEQEAPVLAGTIRDNLLLTTPNATDERLLAVLDAVNLTDIVGRTPLGLDAEVGEGGVLLSGGERQRLAIARTLLSAPPILLLDEPTSNLDARNEAALRQAIDAAAQRRTLLVVAHRLSTVVDSDQIVVLDAGRVVAVGRHDELTASNPLYRELASHQLLVA